MLQEVVAAVVVKTYPGRQQRHAALQLSRPVVAHLAEEMRKRAQLGREVQGHTYDALMW